MNKLARIAIALLVGVLHVLFFLSSWGERLEMGAIDLWFSVRGKLKPPAEVVIVAMDEASYGTLQLPLDRAWPRDLHAQLLERLAAAGAKRAVMDILFLGPGPDAEKDAALARAVKTLPVVLGVDSAVKTQGVGLQQYTFEELLEPLDSLAEGVAALGLTRLPEDSGFVRRFFVPRTEATATIPALHEAAVGRSRDSPENPGPRDMLWYYGPAGTIPTLSYHLLVSGKGRFPAEAVKDKIVFIGLSLRTELGPAQKDAYQTPFGKYGGVFGVEIQATAAANLLENRWIHRLPSWIESLFVGLLAAAFCFFASLYRPQISALAFAAILLVWSGGAFGAFVGGIFLPGASLCMVTLPGLLLCSSIYFYVTTSRKAEQTEKAFQLYLSPAMAKQMRTNSAQLERSGESVWATALFTDIEGFSDITENMSASDVSRMLNEYFDQVTQCVLDADGTLIKFIGDAVFAIWGAPIKSGDHAKRAMEAGQAIARVVAEFNAQKKYPALRTRIGIHTGNMVVGNLGSARRFDYTAIGDAVNLAARLEGLNKYLGTEILVSDVVRKEIGDASRLVPLGAVRVAGKRDISVIHTILASPLDFELLSKWNDGLAAFRARRWKAASDLFESVSQTRVELSRAATVFCQFCEKAAREGVPDDWSGELVFLNK